MQYEVRSPKSGGRLRSIGRVLVGAVYGARSVSHRLSFGLRTSYFVLLLLLPRPAAAQAVLTQDEALRLAFPGATAIERRTAYLSEAQMARARARAGKGVEVRQGVVTYYVGRRGSQPLGVAYFDAHRVRTLPEVLMVVVGTRGEAERIEVLKFAEPPEYRAPEGWLDQFDGRALGEGISLKRDIRNLTGATLTAGAVTGAVRRVLALHEAIAPLGAGPGTAPR